MATTKSPPTTKPKPKAERIKATVKEQVIATLGRPRDLWRIDVHLYKAGLARVNVWRTVQVDQKAGKGFLGAMGQPDLIEQILITDSHYLHLSSTAIIEEANPPIKRRY